MLQLRRAHGFTLIELLLVIGIIAVLASIVIVAVEPQRQLADARDAERNAYLRELGNAVIQYQIDYGQFPGNHPLETGTGGALPVCREGVTAQQDNSCLSLDALVPVYLSALKVDQLESNPYLTGFGVYLAEGLQPLATSYYLGQRQSIVSPTDYIAYWRLDLPQTGLDVLDDTHTFTGFTINMAGTPQPSTNVPPALARMSARSWSFDGNDDYIQAVAPDVSTISICAWIYSRAWNTDSDLQDIIVRAGQGDSASRFLLEFSGVPAGGSTGTKALRFGVEGSPSLVVFDANGENGYPGIGINQWYHICGTHDGSTARIYVDGQEVDSTPGAPAIGSTSPVMYIGGRSGTAGDSFTGEIDDLRIYNRALSAAEISLLASGR